MKKNMINATNVSQKESSTPLKRGGKVLNEAEIQECLSNGGIILSSGEKGIPMTEEQAIAGKFKVCAINSIKRYVEAVKMVRSGEYKQEDIVFILQEGHFSLRTVYGIYLSMCMEQEINKKITWRAFYMQCNGYRTLKPNTIEAVARFVVMMIDGPSKFIKKQ